MKCLFGNEIRHLWILNVLSIVFFNLCLWVIVLLLLVAAAADVDDIYLGNCGENIQRDSASNYCLVSPSGKTNGLNKFTMNCFLFFYFLLMISIQEIVWENVERENIQRDSAHPIVLALPQGNQFPTLWWDEKISGLECHIFAAADNFISV